MQLSQVLMIFPILLALLAAVSPARGQASLLEAVTKPSGDVELSFVRPGRVAEVKVKEGEVVKAGQLLAAQDDQVEQLQLVQLAAKADNRTRIAAAQAELLQKQEDLKKIEGARKKGAATAWEEEHARLNVQIARLTAQMARFEHEQDRLKHEEVKAEVERMRLLSPIEGLVEEVTVEPGESPQPLKMAVRVVKIDPLWVDVIVPLELARPLQPGKSAYVNFPPSVRAGEEGLEGRITFVSAVSRAGSDTLRIRVEVANPHRRPAGERVSVRFALPATASLEKE